MHDSFVLFVCFLQSYYFDRDDVALRNFAKYFLHQSHEEREHAEKLMKMQNQRGGRIFLQDVKVRRLLTFVGKQRSFKPLHYAVQPETNPSM